MRLDPRLQWCQIAVAYLSALGSGMSVLHSRLLDVLTTRTMNSQIGSPSLIHHKTVRVPRQPLSITLFVVREFNWFHRLPFHSPRGSQFTSMPLWERDATGDRRPGHRSPLPDALRTLRARGVERVEIRLVNSMDELSRS
jgi:hypothetical protein